MTSNPFETVVADREKFSIRLEVPPDLIDKVGKPAMTGGACGTIAALTAAHIVGPATVIKFLGFTIYASSGPIGWAIGAGVAAFGAGCAAHVLARKAEECLGSTGTYRKEFEGSLSEIGKLVADIVFRPMAALAMSDWNEDRRDYMLRQFDHWGYDRAWARNFLRGLRECKDDVLGPTMEIISCKGFGGWNIKDKAIEKRHLLDRAIEKLDNAASDFGGDQRMVREREEVIRRQLEENFRD